MYSSFPFSTSCLPISCVCHLISLISRLHFFCPSASKPVSSFPSSLLSLRCLVITHLPHFLLFLLPTSQLVVCVCATVCYTFTMWCVFFDSILAGQHPSSSLIWLNTLREKNKTFLFCALAHYPISFSTICRWFQGRKTDKKKTC